MQFKGTDQQFLLTLRLRQIEEYIEFREFNQRLVDIARKLDDYDAKVRTELAEAVKERVRENGMK